jgi:hypothetical protein
MDIPYGRSPRQSLTQILYDTTRTSILSTLLKIKNLRFFLLSVQGLTPSISSLENNQISEIFIK